MRQAKVRPVAMSNYLSDKPTNIALQLTDNWQENYGSERRHDRDFWYARRAFLNSYHFSEENGFKHKLKRSVKELNEMAIGVVSDICQKMSKRRLGIRVYRFTVALAPSLVLVTLRCFTPWLNKRKSMPCP
ncbi:putative Transmembrane protein [Fagus crenata]